MAQEINPWVDMWIKPRQTIRWVNKTNPNLRLWWLAGIYGFPVLLRACQGLSLGLDLSLPMIFLICILLAAPVGMLGFVITSWLAYWMGKWLGGSASCKEIRAAIAWSKVTNIGVDLGWILLAVLFGTPVFYAGFAGATFTGMGYAAFSIITFAQAALVVWSFILLFAAMAEVQKFSVWKAIINVILPFIVVAIAIWELLVFVFWAIGMKG